MFWVDSEGEHREPCPDSTSEWPVWGVAGRGGGAGFEGGLAFS